MEFIILDYIKHEKYGELAHCITDNNEIIFAKVIRNEDTVIYERLPDEDQNEIFNELEENEYDVED